MYIHIYRGGGNTSAHAVRPRGWSEGQGHVSRGACAEGLLGGPGLPKTQSSGQKFIFIYLEIRCISAAFDLVDSWPSSLLKLLN